MTQTPDRIWAMWEEDFGAVQMGNWADTVRFSPGGLEYIRADLVPQWQPIETAPRDGNIILAYCQPCDKFPEGRMMIWRSSILHSAMQSGPNHLQFPATHWMPLPSPPA